MNDGPTQNNILIQYLDGELSAEEAARLEEELKNTPALREKLDVLRAAKQSVQLYALREQVKGIHQEMVQEINRETGGSIQPGNEQGISQRTGYGIHPGDEKGISQRTGESIHPGDEKGISQRTGEDINRGLGKKPAPVVNIRRTVLRVVAAILVLASLVTLYEYKQLSPASLYGENFRPYTITTNRGARDSATLESIYDKGTPQDVIRAFKSLAAPTLRDYFLAGNAFLNAGDAAQAIQAFQTLRQLNEQAHTHVLEEDAEYYLAMSYLKNGETGAALPLFEKIRHDPDHLYHDKVGKWWLWRLHNSRGR